MLAINICPEKRLFSFATVFDTFVEENHSIFVQCEIKQHLHTIWLRHLNTDNIHCRNGILYKLSILY